MKEKTLPITQKEKYLFWCKVPCCATKKDIFSLPGGLELPTPTISGGF